jgi:hypothetical protein
VAAARGLSWGMGRDGPGRADLGLGYHGMHVGRKRAARAERREWAEQEEAGWGRNEKRKETLEKREMVR